MKRKKKNVPSSQLSKFLCVSGCAVKLPMLFCVSGSRCNTVNQPLSLPVTKKLTQAHRSYQSYFSQKNTRPSLSTNVEPVTRLFMLSCFATTTTKIRKKKQKKKKQPLPSDPQNNCQCIKA